MTVTIYDVAKKAGVGIATVSRVLNDSPAVSETNRQKVLQAVEALNYQPSSTARNLARGDTYTIGVMSPFISQHWFSDRIRGIQDVLNPTIYDLVVFSIGTADQMIQQYSSMSKFKFVSGMIIVSMGVSDEDVARFEQWNTPVVLLDNLHPKLSCVTIDDKFGGYKATRYLIELGHKNIAFVGGALENDFRFNSDTERYAGYRSALQEATIPFVPSYHIQSAYDYETGFQVAKDLINLPIPPTAIFAANDIVAFGVIDGIRDCGKNVPEDISIIGHDDNPLAKYYQCTTITQDFYESGRMAASMLLKLLTEKHLDLQRASLVGDLIIRGSTQALS